MDRHFSKKKKPTTKLASLPTQTGNSSRPFVFMNYCFITLFKKHLPFIGYLGSIALSTDLFKSPDDAPLFNLPITDRAIFSASSLDLNPASIREAVD